MPNQFIPFCLSNDFPLFADGQGRSSMNVNQIQIVMYNAGLKEIIFGTFVGKWYSIFIF